MRLPEEGAVDTRPQDTTDGTKDLGKHVQSAISDVKRQIRSGVRRIDESTVPDTFRKVPKLISPKVHAWLDVAVTGYFVVLGAWFAARGKRGLATAAFFNAGMVAGVSLFTDYEGTGEKPVSFKMHGTLDAVQATMAASAPALFGFAGETEAAFFYGQAANEFVVIASTDWDRGIESVSRGKAA